MGEEDGMTLDSKLIPLLFVIEDRRAWNVTIAVHKLWYDDPKILFLLYQNLVY